jgi:hypothetical protein
MSGVGELLEGKISFKDTEKLIDEIVKTRRESKEKLKADWEEKWAKDKAREIAKRIKNEVIECNHPILRKVINWGGLKRKGRPLEETIYDLLVKEDKELGAEEFRRLSEKLGEFREEALGYVEERMRGVEGRDLKPEHAPGSVSRTEAGNLYFGEGYNEQTLVQLATQLSDSTCIGQNFGVYFSNSELRDDLKRELISSFGKEHITSPGDLHKLFIEPQLESDKPYLLLLKLLLWLYRRYLEEPEATRKGSLRRMCQLLRETDGVLYFTPGLERMKWATIPLPRLDIFFSRWLDADERRRSLQEMSHGLYHFIGDVRRAVTKKAEPAVQNKFELLVTYYDMFCAQLLRSGTIPDEVLRRIVDIVMELSDQCGVSINLSFVKGLTSL